jgi:chromosome segregation ATPase
MQEATIALIMAVASILGAVGVGARLLLNRMKRLEQEDEQRRILEQKELKTLRERVADLEVKAKRVPILESQVCTLLAEMSTLQQKVRDLNEALQAALDREAQLVRENGDLREERDRLRAEKHDLETAKAAYERALQLVGAERKSASAEPGEAHETEPERAGEA